MTLKKSLYRSDFIFLVNRTYEVVTGFTGEGVPDPDGKDVVVTFELFDKNKKLIDAPVLGLSRSQKYGQYCYAPVVNLSSGQAGGKLITFPEQAAYTKLQILKWHFDGKISCMQPPALVPPKNTALSRDTQNRRMESENSLYRSNFIAVEKNKTYEVGTEFTGEGVLDQAGKDVVVTFELFDKNKTLIDAPVLGLTLSPKYGQYLYAPAVNPDVREANNKYITFPEQVAYIKLQIYKWGFYGKISCAQPPKLTAKNRNAIVFICDDNYAGTTFVAIKSLLQSKQYDTIYDIYIIYTGNNETSIDGLIRLQSNTASISVLRSSDIHREKYDHMYVSTSALHKFKIQDIITNYDVALYCDTDIMFTADISELFKVDLGNSYAAVIKDAIAMLRNFDHVRLNKKTYFNSGVMLLNLKKLREENSYEKMIQLKDTHPNNEYMDQDIFNIYFGDNVISIDYKYNYIASYATRFDEKELLYLYGSLCKEFKIIHFAGIIREDVAQLPIYKTWAQAHKQSQFTNGAFLPPIKQGPALKAPEKQSSTLETLEKRIWNVERKIEHTYRELCEFMKFLFLPVRDRSVLLVEGSNSHAETIPGFAHYFQELGFFVDILMTSRNFNMRPFTRMNMSDIHINHAHELSLLEMLQVKKIENYEYIFFNSRTLYFKTAYTKYPAYNELFSDMAAPKRKILSVEHRWEFMTADTDKSNICVLEHAEYDQALNKNVVYPFYFGKIDITDKNTDIVKFIAVGNFDAPRRDHNILFTAAAGLLSENYLNFKIILIGRNAKSLQIPTELTSFVDIYANCPYETIYQNIEQADFYLPLLNPSNSAHLRYLSMGTSGSIQLIYTFSKPCVIHEKFAPRFGFNNRNSILYTDDTAEFSFTAALKKAYILPTKEYGKLQSELTHLADKKRALSLENLRSMLAESNS